MIPHTGARLRGALAAGAVIGILSLATGCSSSSKAGATAPAVRIDNRVACVAIQERAQELVQSGQLNSLPSGSAAYRAEAIAIRRAADAADGPVKAAALEAADALSTLADEIVKITPGRLYTIPDAQPYVTASEKLQTACA